LREDEVTLVNHPADQKSMTLTPLIADPFDRDDDLPAEIDFSQGERGKFFRQHARLQLPLYLDDPLQDRLTALAEAKGIELSALVNELLRKDIERIDAAR